MTKVLFATAEAAPFYKTGGLGDVSDALPRALHQAGTTIRVVLPYYAQLMPMRFQRQLTDLCHFDVQVGDHWAYCGIKTLTLAGVTYYLIDNLDYFGRPGMYGYWDDGERFAFFQLAICELMTHVDYIPDVLHLNDWHTAFIPVLLAEKYYWVSAYRKIKTVLTIHNLQFQGIYDPIILDSLFRIGCQTFTETGIEFYGQVNFLKGGINFADAVNTVSPSYAAEIQTPAFGERLDGVLRANAGKLHGIMNGIDMKRYDPATDPDLVAAYSAQDLTPKAIDKVALQQAVGLPVAKVPVLAVVSRLTRQKGMDLLLDALDDFLKMSSAQVIVLGTGDPVLEAAFKTFQTAYPQQVAAQIKFDVQLAQQLYAGSDLFLMPSAFEPSGLSQMMAMRYGTLPLVHLVGGLKDTVQPYNHYTGAGTGFGFDDYRPAVLRKVMCQALRVYQEQPAIWQQLQQQAMTQDFGWAQSAAKYQALYQQLCGLDGGAL
ncbi:glycogen synthase GlgA [Lactiplantibacillus mudanjiangensis]|uniref:Glycogen synthase n=1 Tax=Lactiplantibacillus mudanjiangensis TaxID=1296538 RepID=A0A660DUC5_9LACO|nr:glycogen synthase GlgA [Lactiplantibacillus mudanjiangensis]VDG22658.1 starch (glycogen) synthase [Lactobacillus plantarum JDM1] [Lactiplantibacillus mudanjiangensis]VDG26802.1 starch (glycogen) synthase [Lactobacillus plantarum JDM1] [Lactiplantibacillus mudanjiangensis]